jgi:hypothetical protein
MFTPLEIMSRCSAGGLDFRTIPAGFNPLRQPAATGASTAGACVASAPLEFLTGLTFCVWNLDISDCLVIGVWSLDIGLKFQPS